MLIAHGLLPDLVSQLSSYSLFGIAPIWWDQTEGQFKVKKSAITCIGSVITFQLGLVLIVHDFYQQYQLAAVANPVESSSGSIPAIEKGYSRTQRISCALLLFMVAIVHDRNMRSAHAIVTLFNGMIAFEQKHTGRLRLPTDWKGKTTKYFCLLVRFFNNIGPLLISILVVVAEPSSPLNVVPFLQTSQTLTTSSSSSTYSSSSSGELGDANGGSDLSSSSSGITIITSNQMVQKFITGTITALLNMMVWYMVVNIRGFWTCGQVLIGCYGIRSALNLYSSIMTRGKLLRITKEKVQEAFIYREIQLLANLFNEVHGNSIFVILLLLSSLLQTISLYLYVRFVTTMTSSNFFVLSGWTWTSRLFVAYMVFDSIFVVFVVFGCCSEVYITSVQKENSAMPVEAALQLPSVFLLKW
ncbi:unnamed protein product [Orchesella dallaii]|uniref:Gustatory receptor n=1 Tax=Orchesella dallaii TaxID=48710 RepID=A0ABP1S359_9HEXA